MNMTPNAVIAEAIRRWPGSLRAVARKAELSPAYVSDIATGKRLLSTEAAVRLAPVLGLDARTLLIMRVDDELIAAGVTA